ncbi:MAG TPA: DUF1549 domain-containing protein [Planctomycetes bacterium]|nr:DUF1549 domain-containing protein [Planctomycetota bacterium]
MRSIRDHLTVRLTITCWIALSMGGVIADAADAAKTPARQVLFSRDIQPLLARKCLVCHGPDEAESGLRLDSADRAYAMLESGTRAIVPGKTATSELLRRIATGDDSERMPPEGDPLTEDEISLFRQWIAGGAKYETHWAYRQILPPSLPTVKNSAWVRSPIDQIVLARLQKMGIVPSPEADRPTLIKRLYYDLIGLPPTPSEVDAFVADVSPNAYQSVVERLLKSEHFGERWGRHWLDKARYADSDGYEKDRPRANAWRYRDWVIEAINQDMPFDQFTIEQLAGDLLPDATSMQKLATAFHRQTLTNTEGGTDQEQFRVEATFDRTETTASVWMGLTMTCARCHTHKYDKISQREYYQLFAFFNNSNEANFAVPTSEEAMQEYLLEKSTHDEKVAALEAEYTKAKKTIQPQVEAWVTEMEAKINASSVPLSFAAIELISATATSKATLIQQDDGSLLVSGTVSDKDKYTLVVKVPATPLTGLKLEVLTDDSLAKKGPGRAPNGNFVLSELRVYSATNQDFSQPQRIELATAEANFSQDNFLPSGAINSKDRTGWAISPQMGKNHHITMYTRAPVLFEGQHFLQIVLDQQYGGTHTIGRFRLTTMSGFDPLRALSKDLANALRVEAAKRTDKQRQQFADHVASLDPTTVKLANQLAELKKKAPKSPTMSVRIIASADRKTRLLHRGDFLQPADEVSIGVLAAVCDEHPLTARSADQKPDRLDLASWLVKPEHPLTSRVVVNQVWAHLFGEGIVRTLNDFGVRGKLPTHPELLDWLAYQFPRELHWSRKDLIKMIVTSATYRQSSRHRQELDTIDPTNLLLSRQNRVRVEAEIVRDLSLSISGLLSKKIGGSSVFPPLPAGVAELSYANSFKWSTSKGEDRYRRGLYTFFKRTSPHPTLISFDCPDSNTTRLQRASSNTPLQALIMLNNDVFIEAAQAMTRRVLAEDSENDVQRLTFALRLCIARQPSDAEVIRFHKLLVKSRAYYQSHPDDATKLTARHAVEGMSAAENAAWVATLRIVINLDEFIVRG